MENYNIREEFDYRLTLMKTIKSNHALMRAEKERCKRSIIQFVNNWCFTYDPRDDVRHLPFKLWPYQEESLMWLDKMYAEKEVAMIEKSRDMGATWIMTAWALHKFIFDSGFSCLFGSKKEDLVDDKTLDSIFGKIRYNLYRLPEFLRPPMFQKLDDGNDADRYLVLVNPTNGNEIVGESTNDNFARGGRKSIVFLDEFAFVEHSDRVWMSVRDVSDVIIATSTPNGKGNMFAKLKHQHKVPCLTLHWKNHPKKDQAWYEGRKKDMEPWQIAQELDIDYDASKSGRVYKAFAKQYHVADQIIHPNPNFEHFVTWDFGIADSMTMIFGQIDTEGTIELYACYEMTNHDIDFFLPLTQGSRPPNNEWKLLSEKEQRDISRLLDKVFYDPIAKERVYLDFSHYGDYAGTQRTANSKRSVRERMKTDPYNINLICSRNQSFPNRIQALGQLLKLRQLRDGSLASRFRISPDCGPVIDAFMNYVWDSEDVNQPNIKPKHDWSSHFMSSLEFFAINRYPVVPRGTSSQEKVR